VGCVTAERRRAGCAFFRLPIAASLGGILAKIDVGCFTVQVPHELGVEHGGTANAWASIESD
jgi:hypothetical protein